MFVQLESKKKRNENEGLLISINTRVHSDLLPISLGWKTNGGLTLTWNGKDATGK